MGYMDIVYVTILSCPATLVCCVWLLQTWLVIFAFECMASWGQSWILLWQVIIYQYMYLYNAIILTYNVINWTCGESMTAHTLCELHQQQWKHLHVWQLMNQDVDSQQCKYWVWAKYSNISVFGPAYNGIEWHIMTYNDLSTSCQGLCWFWCRFLGRLGQTTVWPQFDPWQ